MFLAQSTWENKFWSSTLHINSKRSTSHWLYVWLCKSPNSAFCHSRSSTVCTNSLIIGETRKVSVLVASAVLDGVAAVFDCVSNVKASGDAECGEWASHLSWVGGGGGCGGCGWAPRSAGPGDDSGEDVNDDTCGICISCLTDTAVYGEPKPRTNPPSPREPRRVWTAICRWRIICSLRARSRLYIGPNLLRPPRIRSARTAENHKKITHIVIVVKFVIFYQFR